MASVRFRLQVVNPCLYVSGTRKASPTYKKSFEVTRFDRGINQLEGFAGRFRNLGHGQLELLHLITLCGLPPCAAVGGMLRSDCPPNYSKGNASV